MNKVNSIIIFASLLFVFGNAFAFDWNVPDLSRPDFYKPQKFDPLGPDFYKKMKELEDNMALLNARMNYPSGKDGVTVCTYLGNQVLVKEGQIYKCSGTVRLASNCNDKYVCEGTETLLENVDDCLLVSVSKKSEANEQICIGGYMKVTNNGIKCVNGRSFNKTELENRCAGINNNDYLQCDYYPNSGKLNMDENPRQKMCGNSQQCSHCKFSTSGLYHAEKVV